MSKQITHLSELIPDPRNARRHTPRNIGLLERSLQEVGAARSIVIDENNVVLAGNGVIEAAGSAGMQRVRVVDTRGDEIIAVRRTGLTPEQKIKLALYDNRVSSLSDFDPAVLAELSQEIDLTGMWSADELTKVLTYKETLGFLADDMPLSLPPKPAAEQDRIPLAIVLNTYEARRWREYKESIDERDDKKALLVLLETV